MFVTSPIQPPPTPSQSKHQTPPASLSPMHSSPPTVTQSKKRSRSVYEDPAQTGMRALTEIVERTSREIRHGQERLGQKLDEECTKRQLLDQHWEEQFRLARNDDRTERERVALELEQRLCGDRQKNEAERKRIEQALAENGMRLTTLDGQLESQSQRMESRMDEQASQSSVIQGELGGQRARQNVISTRLEGYTQSHRDLKKNQDALQERLRKAEVQAELEQEYVHEKLRVLEAECAKLRDLQAACRPTGPAATNQQGLARARSFGGRTRRSHEVRPRTDGDWDMHGKKPGVLSDTLIRNGLPPLQPRTPGGNLASSSSSRSAHPKAPNTSASKADKANEGTIRQTRSVQTGPDRHHPRHECCGTLTPSTVRATFDLPSIPTAPRASNPRLSHRPLVLAQAPPTHPRNHMPKPPRHLSKEPSSSPLSRLTPSPRRRPPPAHPTQQQQQQQQRVNPTPHRAGFHVSRTKK